MLIQIVIYIFKFLLIIIKKVIKFLLIAKFIYNNIKNSSTSYILFKLNYNYYFSIFLEKNIYSYFSSKLANKLVNKLQYLINICLKTSIIPKNIKNRLIIKMSNLKVLFYIKKFNSKYIKTK